MISLTKHINVTAPIQLPPKGTVPHISSVLHQLRLARAAGSCFVHDISFAIGEQDPALEEVTSAISLAPAALLGCFK